MTTEPVPIPGYNGCEWPVDPACFDEEWEELDPLVQGRATALASSTLHRLTGYRVGGCPITVRPCKKGCTDQAPMPFATAWMYPHIGVNGYWINSCGCSTDCSCTVLCEVALPAPVGAVYEVVVDGTIIPEDDYRVDGSTLLWVGTGECPWPTCQDLTLPDSEPGTFSITYLNSYPVDQLGAYACAVLAMEYARACAGDSCRLPDGITAVVRQGVSFEITTGAFPGGLTGIKEVDSYLALWNPEGIRQAPSVYSPDLPRTRVVR